MQLHKFLVIPVFCLSALLATGQDFAKRFKDLLVNKDTIGQRELLESWETSNSNDPELFVAYFNYYAQKSMKEVVSIDRDKKNDQSFVITDSAGRSVGYMYSSIKYNSEILQKGFDYINQGISLFPTRLDMRFGKIYMLEQAENFPEFTKTISETIDYGNEINNAWTWKEGKPLDDAEQFFLNAMQEYITNIYNTGDDNLLPYMRQISEAVLKYYPDHVISLSNVALTYLISGDYDKALPYLLKAETTAPKDIIVLNNIAEAYKRKGDKANAKIYYGKIIKYGNKEEVNKAKERIKKL